MAAAKGANSKAPKKSKNSAAKSFFKAIKIVPHEIYNHQDKCIIC